MGVTLQGIVRTAFARFATTRGLPARVYKAARSIAACQTGELGRHGVFCTQGHLLDVRQNSCRHRSCPQCGGKKREQWLESWKQRLLPTKHFQVVFTLPGKLRPLWQYNRKLLAHALFGAVRDTLLTLLSDPRHLGVQPGFLLGLHTWGGALTVHPHIHCLLTAGGLTPAGRWRSARKAFLVYAPTLRDTFRTKMLAAVRALQRQRKLSLPPDLGDAALSALLDQLAVDEWHVRIEPPYRHGRGLVAYLARYLVGGPIKDHRLKAFDGQSVSFSYRDHRGRSKPKWSTISLPVESFLARLFEHVPPTGLHMVRGYGLYGRRGAERREYCRRLLQPTSTPVLPSTAPDPEVCPLCGAPVVIPPPFCSQLRRTPFIIPTALSPP